jgi:competence protein ComFC
MNPLTGPIDNLTRWTGSVMDFFYPPVCLTCRRSLITEEKYICQVCLAEIITRWEWQCDKCGAVGVGREPEPGHRCRLCPSIGNDYEGVLSAVDYHGAAARCVHQFKYIHRAQTGDLMSRVMREHLSPLIRPIVPRLDLVTPVPLHWIRRIQRGFNQSVRLARELSDSLELRYEGNLLRRVRNTRRQATIPQQQRAGNVAGAFKVRRVRDLSESGILLVDDVLTSGSTAQECAAALKRAGTREVWIATFARIGLTHGSMKNTSK